MQSGLDCKNWKYDAIQSAIKSCFLEWISNPGAIHQKGMQSGFCNPAITILPMPGPGPVDYGFDRAGPGLGLKYMGSGWSGPPVGEPVTNIVLHTACMVVAIRKSAVTLKIPVTAAGGSVTFRERPRSLLLDTNRVYTADTVSLFNDLYRLSSCMYLHTYSAAY